MIVVPLKYILFLSILSHSYIDLLEVISLQLASKCCAYAMKLIISFFYSISLGMIPSIFFSLALVGLSSSPGDDNTSSSDYSSSSSSSSASSGLMVSSTGLKPPFKSFNIYPFIFLGIVNIDA